jgi:7-cyano-7-deazaguanine synthase in queuosine biosynthesis
LDLRKQLQDKKNAMLSTKHSNEKAALETRQAEEMKEFTEAWELRMSEYQANSAKQEEELVTRHSTQYFEHRSKLEADIPTIPKHATDYLNAKRIQESLVRQRNYNEAHKIQQVMMQLEAEEQEHWGDTRKNKIEQALRTLQAQQEAEMQGFKKKATTGLAELKKEKAVEMEKLMRRFQNLKKELETHQRIEQNKLDGRHSMGATVDLRSTRSLFRSVSETPSPS